MALDELREARDMTQQHLARILKINQAAVSEMGPTPHIRKERECEGKPGGGGGYPLCSRKCTGPEMGNVVV